MGRPASACSEKVGLKKGPWTPEEDLKLLAYIQQHGHGSWCSLPAKAGLQRCGKSCRLRWTNYLRPDIKRGKFSSQEEQTIIQLHALLGNRWSTIAAHLPKRTDNEIKNYWNSQIKKRLTKMGIDPMTHKPKSKAAFLSSDISHMAQWETARLEAESRLVRKSKHFAHNSNYQLSSQLEPSPSTQLHHKVAIPPPPPLLPCLDILKVWQGIIWSNSTYGNNLQLPTSTLNLSENTLKILPFSENPLASMINCDQDMIATLNQAMKTPMQNIKDIAYPNDASLYIDGYDNHNFANNGSGWCDDDLEENKNYPDSLLNNWVMISPSSGVSPMF